MSETIEYEFKTKEELKRSYMPLLTNGGLFIRTVQNYVRGTEVSLNFTLLGKKPMTVKGKIVWITPKGASDVFLTPGVGVEFADTEGTDLRKMIERELGDYHAEALSYTIE